MTPEIDEDDEIIFILVTCSTPVSDEVHPDFYDNIFPDEDVDYDMSSVDLNDVSPFTGDNYTITR